MPRLSRNWVCFEREIVADDADELDGRKQGSGGGAVGRGAAKGVVNGSGGRFDGIERDRTDDLKRDSWGAAKLNRFGRICRVMADDKTPHRVIFSRRDVCDLNLLRGRRRDFDAFGRTFNFLGDFHFVFFRFCGRFDDFGRFGRLARRIAVDDARRRQTLHGGKSPVVARHVGEKAGHLFGLHHAGRCLRHNRGSDFGRGRDNSFGGDRLHGGFRLRFNDRLGGDFGRPRLFSPEPGPEPGRRFSRRVRQSRPRRVARTRRERTENVSW